MSNEALCVINGITPIHINIEEIGRLYEITQGIGTQHDKDMEPKNWTHPATHIKIIEGDEESLHPIQAYTDAIKSDLGVGAGVVIFLDNYLIKTMQYRLNERCTNNQAEQMAILKALEYVQNMELDEKLVLVNTDSKITIQLLQNRKKHTNLIEQIRTKVQEMEQRDWRVDFRWIKAHAGHRGNKMADKQTKEAAKNKNIEECYMKIPKSVVISELKEQSVTWWQREWTGNNKRCNNKNIFSQNRG